MRKHLFLSASLLVLAFHLNAQNYLGQFYTVQDPRNPNKPEMKIRYRLDSIVGDARTGLLTIYQSIGGNSAVWYDGKFCLGHYVEYYIKTTNNTESNDKSLYIQFPKDGYRALMLREIAQSNRSASSVTKIEISFGEDVKSLTYNNAPIIWHTHATDKACRPAEYYLNDQQNENMTGGTAVTPYTGGMTKQLSEYSSSNFGGYRDDRDVVINRTINLELKGVVGNIQTGMICPIFSIMTTHDDDYYPNILNINLYDEDGNRRFIEGKPYYSPENFWTEVGDLTTRITPGSATLQKMIVLVGNSSYSTTERVFTFKDVPIQWIEVK